MFRGCSEVLLLQKYYGLSDEKTEFQIMDRFSFLQFLGLRGQRLKTLAHGSRPKRRIRKKQNTDTGLKVDSMRGAMCLN